MADSDLSRSIAGPIEDTGAQRFARSAQHRAREILQTARAIEGVSI